MIKRFDPDRVSRIATFQDLQDQLKDFGLTINLQKPPGTNQWVARVAAKAGGWRGVFSKVNVEYTGDSPEEALQGLMTKVEELA